MNFKRGVLILFLLLIPSASATISLDQFTVSTHNLGDRFLVGGTVTPDQTFRGNLFLEFTCEQGSSTTATLLLDLESGKSTAFSSLVTIPDTLLGRCTMKGSLSKNGNVLETQTSDSFLATNDLRGSFEPVLPSYQLSEKLSLKGIFTKADGTGIDGSALLYYKQGNVTLLVENVDVRAGNLAYIKDLSLIPPGVYTLSAHVSDASQNRHVFESFATFSLANALTISVHPDKELYSPGDTVVLRGSIQGKTGKELKNVRVFTSAFEKELSATLKSNNDAFTLSFVLPKDVKSGDHQLSFTAKDDTGNYGEQIVGYSVRSIPTTLKLVVNTTSIIPSQEVHFSLDLRDQANDAFKDSLLTSLFNQKGTFEKSKLVKIGTDDYFVLSADSLPGTWKLKAEGFGLQAEQPFTVQPHQLLTTELHEGTLTAHNIGNVLFEGYFALKADTLEKGETISLDLNETTDFVLNKLFPPGTYTLYIPLTNQTYSGVHVLPRETFFGNLKDSLFNSVGKPFDGITGKVTARLSSSVDDPTRQLALYGLLVLILGGLVFMLWNHRAQSKTDIYVHEQHRDASFKEGRKMLAELQKRGIRKPSQQQFGVADEKDIQDFRNRMKTAYETHQAHEKKNAYQSDGYPTLRPAATRQPPASSTPSTPPPEPEKKEGSIFDMFK
ncbi:hypothetical protein HZB00_02910 [Candidatus Woesearchaeota archaeon]|nr:hypothetical protein [Candidatus Woesearchaeota archaeon]